MVTVSFLLQLTALVLAADFVSGFFHWLEDAYGHPDTPLLGPLIVRPNIVHHHQPRRFLRHGWWHSSWDLLCIALLVVLGAYWLGCLTWHVWVFAVLTANVNQFHKWAHRTRAENGPLISLLHDLRLLQTARHHARHHTDPKNVAYCVLTNALNPCLDRLRFWDTLEHVIWKLTGLRRRADTSVNGQGPAPEWLRAEITN
jgi:ubiquitin-conjugating enzyme E2 variant